MAELLLHRFGRGDPDDRYDWSPLDVVWIAENGWTWGSQEVGDGTTFFLVRLPDVAVATVQQLTDEVYEAVEVDGVTQQNYVARRRFRINYDKLPLQVQEQLAFGFEVTLTGIPEVQFLAAAEDTTDGN